MRAPLHYLLVSGFLGGAVLAGPKAPECVATSEEAVKIARTRGKLIFLTVLVDHDNEARMVADQTFRDKAFLKIAKNFVFLYANNENDHGERMAKDPKTGKREARCADCPSIRCEHHMMLAQSYARAFYPGSTARAPCHFVLNANEDVVQIIKAGDFKTGLQIVPVKRLVAELKKVIKKHGKGLTEKEYAELTKLLVDARAARARKKTELELEKLTAAVKFQRRLSIEGVEKAKARVKEIDKEARRKLKAVEPLAEAKEWEKALDALDQIIKGYPGTLTEADARRRKGELGRNPEVKRLTKARDLYEAGMKFMERKRVDLARKRFEKCVRLFDGNKYADLAKVQLERLG